MPMVKPQRWSPRALLGVQLPHLFRKPKSPQEWIGPSSERVPLDAHLQHMFISRKQTKFKKDILQRYGLNRRTPDLRRKLWSVLTGEWVWEHTIHPTHIYPPSLGAKIESELMDTGWLWQGGNGLMLPKPIGRALHDWALTIVPDRSGANLMPAKDGGHLFLQDYKVKILDPENQGLRVPIYPREGPNEEYEEIIGTDLDGRQLAFNTQGRPVTKLLYFHCCCAIWKRTCLQNPEITECAEFEEVFLESMIELWGQSVVADSFRSITDVFRPREAGEDAYVNNEYWD